MVLPTQNPRSNIKNRSIMLSMFRTTVSAAARSSTRTIGLRDLSGTPFARSAVKPGSESEATTPGSGSVSPRVLPPLLTCLSNH